MLTQNYGKLTLTVIALFLCSTHGAFPHNTAVGAPKPARKTLDLQIEVTTGNPAVKVEGAKVILVSEEEGLQFTKDKRTSKHGMAKFSQVPQGKLKIQVIAKDCDSFGEVFTLTQGNQTIKISVKKRTKT